MNNLEYTNRRIIRLILTILLIVLLNVVVICVFATNLENEEETIELESVIEHISEVPEGYTGIYSADDLIGVSSNLSGKYILMDDIDLVNITWNILGTSSSSTFTGTLDGNNYKISNLNIESSNQYVGMFGYINGGTVKNLIIENETVKSTYASSSAVGYVGGLIGYIKVGTIENVKIIGTSNVENTAGSNTAYVGGLVGYATQTNIDYANTNVEVIGNGKTGIIYVGGLVGYTYGTSSTTCVKITNAYTTGNTTINSTTGTVYAGGLVGCARYTMITNVYTTGNVNAETSGILNIGGLVGYIYGTGTNATNGSTTVVTNAYAIGNIVGKTTKTVNVGGLIGYIYLNTYTSNSSTYYYKVFITNTYAVGEVNVETTAKANLGGLIGYSNAVPTVASSYWSPETTGQEESNGGISKLLQGMLYKSIYTEWDFETIWNIEEGQTLPYLRNIVKPEEVNKENYTYTAYEGDGTETNPYIIKTEEQLQKIRNELGAHCKLANNISLMNEFDVMGNATNPFTGTLDGNNYKISNLNIESSNQYVGMFGYINGGTVKNLIIENETVKSTYASSSAVGYVGGLIGYIKVGTIENVKIIGTSNVENTAGSNTAYVGGLVGYATQTNIDYANTNVEVIGNGKTGIIYVGGLVGYTYGTSSTTCVKITNAYTTGNTTINSTTGTVYAGGLVGCARYTMITNVYTTGNVNAETSGILNIGGLVGYIYGTGTNATNGSTTVVTNAYAIGNIVGKTTKTVNVGGLIGYIYLNTYTSKSSTYYYKVFITNTYVVGEVNAETTAKANLGGLIGCSNAVPTVTSSYWSPETTGQEESTGGIAKLFNSMLYKSMYTDWDFETIWNMEEGQTLPYLRNIEKPEEVNKENYTYTAYEGGGTKEYPYIIKTQEELQNLMALQDVTINSSLLYYKLGNDINITNTFEPIGNATNPFTGIFDGAGYTIKNMNIESAEQYVGVFGYIDGGVIKNLTLENATIVTTYTNSKTGDSNAAYVGGVVGYTTGGEIANVSILGASNIQNTSVVNTTYIGGLVGYNKSLIKYSINCSNIVTSNSTKTYIGGLVGANSGTIKNSYYKGNIDAQANTLNIGGIAGANTQTVRMTYAIGIATLNATTANEGGIVGLNSGDIVNSYWNIENINQSSSNGTYKSIEDMKKQGTYESWNFDYIWKINEGNDTPIINYNLDDIEYFKDEYWEWYTRTTTDDAAYNGQHIQIINDAIYFYGYGIVSYKDFLYKNYNFAGKKTFHFVLDESEVLYHTAEGAGFIFNSSIENNLLSGYILLYSESAISIYRVDDIDIDTFETKSNSTIATTYAKSTIATVKKTADTIHDITVEVTPTSVVVVDNDIEIINEQLNYDNHVGESFGLVSSYLQHNCGKLTKINFEEFSLTIEDYSINVLKTDENGNYLEGAIFEVKDEEGTIISEGKSDTSGIFEIKGIPVGVYTIQEIRSSRWIY